jgi:predicted amidohydrolase YtcJ
MIRPNTQLIDLEGKCLLSGFFDFHSHIIQQSLKFAVVNLDPHPIGDVKSGTKSSGGLEARSPMV